MLKAKLEISPEDKNKLNEHILFVNRMINMQTDKKFQSYIQKECMKILEECINQYLIGGTTNDEYIDLYKESNHIIEYDEGFIIYNDAKIPAQAKDNTTYPEGMFSIALAFEYGVGIIGENTNNDNAWDYNINNYNFGWYFKDTDGTYKQTGGYMGFEIYRHAANKIQEKLNLIVTKYYEDEVK